jgi:predicted nucleic acid-binding protein
MIHVFVDTNAIDVADPFGSAASAALIEAASAGRIRLVIPELVVREVVNRWREDFDDAVTARDQAAETLLRLGAITRRRFPERLTARRPPTPSSAGSGSSYARSERRRRICPASRMTRW